MSFNTRSIGYYINCDRSVSIPCLALCVLIFGIMAVLPVLGDALAQVLRPAFILICILFNRAGRYRLSFEKVLLFMMVYLLFPLGRDHGGDAVTSYVSMALFALFFVIVSSNVWTTRQIQLVFWTAVISCSFYAVIVIVSNGFLWQLGGNQHISFLTQTINRNPASFSVAPGILCAVYLILFRYKSPIIRIVLTVFVLICGYTVIMLACRSAFIASFAGLMLLLWEASGNKINNTSQIIKRTLLIVGVFLGLQLLNSLLSGSNSARIFDYSDSGREEIWEKAWELIQEKPIFGGGFNYWAENGLGIGTHNTFITYLLISGYVGGVILVLFYLAFIKECMSGRHLAALAFFVQTLMHSISEASLDYYAYFPLCFAAMILRREQALEMSRRFSMGNPWD